MRFLRRLGAKKYYGTRVIGLVATGDVPAVRNYLRLGCKIVATLPRTYAEDDAHHVLEYVPGLSRPISRADAARLSTPLPVADLVKSDPLWAFGRTRHPSHFVKAVSLNKSNENLSVVSK